MDLLQFKQLKEEYKNADTDAKIDIYANAERITQTQYKELLLLFPIEEIDRLEEALENLNNL